MSVIASIKITGDTDVFRKSLDVHAQEYRTIAEQAKAAGAIHHQFAVGDGIVLIIDEWESADAFQRFFGDPELRTFMVTVGANLDVPPEIIVGESVDSPDRF